MNESRKEYRILFADNPAKEEKQLYKLAKKGDLNALSALNEYYEKCVTEARTPKELSKIRQKALKAALLGAAQNSPYWLMVVGEMYRYGVGTEKNVKKAFSYYEKSLEWLARAERICRLRLEGELPEKDRNYYESLLEDVDHKRMHCECSACVELVGKEGCPMEQRQKAFSRLSELAHERGDWCAQVNMGVLYEEGTFVGKDERKALEYYLMAAGNGSTGAMNNIGNFYLHGKGVAKDYDKAFEWYQKAVELSGNAAAECSLGMCYQYGYGTKINYEKARCFYELSAKQGIGLAYYRMGLLYEQGLGVTKDVRTAKQYFGEALDRGCREAALKL